MLFLENKFLVLMHVFKTSLIDSSFFVNMNHVKIVKFNVNCTPLVLL